VKLQRADGRGVPINDPDEIAVYDTSGTLPSEVGSWPLDEVEL